MDGVSWEGVWGIERECAHLSVMKDYRIPSNCFKGCTDENCKKKSVVLLPFKSCMSGVK